MISSIGVIELIEVLLRCCNTYREQEPLKSKLACLLSMTRHKQSGEKSSQRESIRRHEHPSIGAITLWWHFLHKNADHEAISCEESSSLPSALRFPRTPHSHIEAFILTILLLISWK